MPIPAEDTTLAEAWAQIEDVQRITGYDASVEQIERAQLIVEIFADTTLDASDQGLISTRNLRLLTAAVAYQTTWMPAHPDIYTNVDATIAQDGVSAQNAHANAWLLAPLAKRCIDRLTWKTAPYRATPPRAALRDTGNRDNPAHDDQYEWSPMGRGGQVNP